MAVYRIKHLAKLEAFKKSIYRFVPKTVFNSSPSKLMRSWLFQGVLYMSAGEKLFRMAVESIIIVFLIFMLYSMNFVHPVMWAIFFGHTIFWMLNSHFWALEIKKGKRMVTNKPSNVLDYLFALNLRANTSPCIDGGVLFGSLARGCFKETSDLDVILVPAAGLVNLLGAYTFAIRERFIAFFKRAPIELYVYRRGFFNMLNDNERPVLLKDSSGYIASAIPEAISFALYPFENTEFFKSSGI